MRRRDANNLLKKLILATIAVPLLMAAVASLGLVWTFAVELLNVMFLP